MAEPLDLVAQRRVLQLETIYDLLVALHGNRSEEELVDDLLERVCAVLDPAAAAVVTRGAQGHARAAACVGWVDRQPDGEALLEDGIWQELLAQGRPLERRDGSFAGRDFQHLLIAPLQYRSTFQGYLAVLDKERRDGDGAEFSEEDLRFLVAVAALAGVTLDGLRQVATLVAASERLAEENKVLRDKLVDEVDGQRIVAHSPEMRRVLERVERVGPRSVSVLVLGESGTGKELIAKLLHLLSGRSGPLIALNCSAMPESLIESELFGIEGGVATGVRARAGQFELASGGRIGLVVADVTGKGMPAALLVSILHSALRLLLDGSELEASLFRQLNEHIVDSSSPNKFITLILVELDPASGALRSLNAGHTPGLLVPTEGEVVELTAGGMPLGLRTGATYDSFHLQMNGGDLLCHYSDGITECEAPDEEEFGLDRLRELLCESRELPLDEILEKIEVATTGFAAGQPQGDDQTVVLLRRSL